MAFFKGLPLTADDQVRISGALFELENKLSAMGTSLCLETLVDGDPGAFPEFLPSCLHTYFFK